MYSLQHSATDTKMKCQTRWCSLLAVDPTTRRAAACTGGERRGHCGSDNFLCVSDFHRPSVPLARWLRGGAVTMAFMGSFFGLIAARSALPCSMPRASERALKKSGNCGPREGKNWENIIRHFLSVTHTPILTHSHAHTSKLITMNEARGIFCPCGEKC